MRSLYLRIWLTVVAVLLLFALIGGVLVYRHTESERARVEAAVAERMEAWGDLIQRSLPGPETDAEHQALALREWSLRLRIPLALDDATGRRIAMSDAFSRREARSAALRALPVQLADGRTLWMMRPARGGLPPRMEGMPPDPALRDELGPPGALPPPPVRAMLPTLTSLSGGVALASLLALLFVAIAAGAYPVVRRLTRRLEALERGVVAFGQGALHQRVKVDGGDEVATLAASFNSAAERIEVLVRSHQSLLANASHELRSPLARMKMAVAMLDDASPAQRAALAREIHTNIAELDALVEEVLLASRLEAGAAFDPQDGVDLLALAAEEGARVGVAAEQLSAGAPVRGQQTCEGDAPKVRGDERLLRRALRNLLENAQRYGGGQASVEVSAGPDAVELRVCDRGPGVPEPERERIFEAFYRMPGHAEVSGGVGLGLSLVRQIAQRHGGSARCEARPGGGSCFVIRLPKAASRPAT